MKFQFILFKTNFLYFLTTVLFYTAASAQFIYVPFDYSMYAQNDISSQQPDYPLFKKYYEARHPATSICNKKSIPKIIHQIWIGSKPIPEKYLALSNSWKKLHPNWEYKLWNDRDVEHWDFRSKDLYNKASSYQEKADILRYAILRKYGGIYVDLDYEALGSFNNIAKKYDFFATIEPILSDEKHIAVTNAIIGSKPNNPIILTTQKMIRSHWNSIEKDFFDNTKKSEVYEKLIHLAVNRTMAPLKSSIKQHLDAEKCTIIFPPTYMAIENRNKFFDPLKNFFNFKSRRLFFRTTKPETLARQLRGNRRGITNLTKK